MALFNRYSLFLFKLFAMAAYVFASWWAVQNRFVLPLYVDVIFFLLFIDRENILSLRNYFIIYGFLIFKLSSFYFFPEKYLLPFDGTLYLTAFLLGYELKKIFSGKEIAVPAVDYAEVEKNIDKVLWLLKLFIGLKLLYLLFIIVYYGFSKFYSGEVLVERTYNYGRKSVLDGILMIYTNFVDSFIAALIVIYIKFISALNRKPNYYYLVTALLIVPLLLLARSAFAFGIVTILSVYAYFIQNKMRVYLVILPAFILLFAVAVYVGNLRLKNYNSLEDFSDVSSTENFFTELTPIIAYNTVKDNIGVLKYQHGRTIVLPLLTKVIPRGFWQTKPDNSTSYYAKEFDPGSFYAGFMMPLTLFGDLYLNFGIPLTCLLLFFTGILIAWFDHVYINKEFRHIDNYFILFICFYSIVRNNIPESVIYVLLILFAKKFIEFFMLKNRPIR